MLCAAWELYLEQLVLEALQAGVVAANSPGQLPQAVQKHLSRVVRDHKHELKPLELAGDGWRQVLVEHAASKVNTLNTPKAGPVNQLFRMLLGVEQISDCWSCGAASVDTIVGTRGEIAHRGRHADYVQIGRLEEYRLTIRGAAVDTDNSVAEHVRDEFPVIRKPWNAAA